jgi:hypothetical protein
MDLIFMIISLISLYCSYERVGESQVTSSCMFVWFTTLELLYRNYLNEQHANKEYTVLAQNDTVRYNCALAQLVPVYNTMSGHVLKH